MRLSILACIVVQVVINSVVVLQTVLQCGPYPYFPVSASCFIVKKCANLTG